MRHRANDGDGHHDGDGRILEELLMDYDQTERPPSPGAVCCSLELRNNCIVLNACSGPTDVKVSILIRSMGPISDTDMVRECDIFYKVSVG